MPKMAHRLCRDSKRGFFIKP